MMMMMMMMMTAHYGRSADQRPNGKQEKHEGVKLTQTICKSASDMESGSDDSAFNFFLISTSFSSFSWQREIGARWVGGSAEIANNNHALDSPRGVPEPARDLYWRARVVALKGVLVKKHIAMVLGDHMDVLRQRPVSDEACPFLHAKPRATGR